MLQARFGFISEVMHFVEDLCVMHDAQVIGEKPLNIQAKTNLNYILTFMISFAFFSLSAIERLSLGQVNAASLSIFCIRNYALISKLRRLALIKVLLLYPQSSCSLLIDDTDRSRSKIVTAIGYVYKTICKITSGYHNAQNIVFICLVTKFITIPIAFAFYKPDPLISTWKKKVKKIKKCKHCRELKKERCGDCREKLKKIGQKPVRDAEKYPTRAEIAAKLLMDVKSIFSELTANGHKYTIQSISADAAYISPFLVGKIHNIFPKTQFLSQLKVNQLVANKSGKFKPLKEYFSNQETVKASINIRNKVKKVEYISARLQVKSHGCRLHVVALKYAEEKEFRYICATELTWRTEDIIRHYGLRWLVEVAIEDWKQYSGWGRKACLQGEEGARCGVNLSLIVDAFFLQHPAQIALQRSGQMLASTGSLSRRIMMQFFYEGLGHTVYSLDPKTQLEALKQSLDDCFVLRPSCKHAAGEWYPEAEPSKSLLRYASG